MLTQFGRLSSVVMLIHSEIKYTVREAAKEDAVELARLRWEFHIEDQAGRSLSEFVYHFEAWLLEALKSRRWVVAVAESETGSLCGCVYLQCIDKVPIPGEIQRSWSYVTNSYVASHHRGRGLGRELLDFIVDVACGRGLEFLIVGPGKESVSFYQRAGFRPVSEAHAGNNDEPPLDLVL